MGAVIGGAIGSVVGVTLKMRKKKEEDLIIEDVPMTKKRRLITFLRKLARKKKGIMGMKEIPTETVIEDTEHDKK
jgi:ribosomal protein S2